MGGALALVQRQAAEVAEDTEGRLMDYAAHYERLIARARGRKLEGYRERHHVLPRCMGGTDDVENIVELTGEEHYVAHQLLVKMNPGNSKLAYATMAMAKQASGNKAFGWLRRRAAKALIGNKHTLGYKHSKESCERMRVAQLRIRTRLGKSHSAETRAKISELQVGKRLTEEHRLNIGNSLRGRPLSAQHRANLSAALKGREFATEWRERMSAAHKNKPLSKEHRDAVSASLIGRSLSDEARQRIADAAMGNQKWLGRRHSEESKAKMRASWEIRRMTKTHKEDV